MSRTILQTHREIYLEGAAYVKAHLDDLFTAEELNCHEDGYIARLARIVSGNWIHLAISAESPIELMLAPYLAILTDGYGYFGEGSGNRPENMSGSFISAQKNIGSFRVDYCIECVVPPDIRYVIVECDGHDFHERTKKQAARDRARDRWFQEKDARILRYTGSEIYADAEGCAVQIGKVVNHEYERLLIARGFIQPRPQPSII